MPPQQPTYRVVRTPDGVEHRFPSEATDAQISEALATVAPPPTAAPESFTDRVIAATKRTVQAMGAAERGLTRAAVEHPATTGALMAGAAAAPFTAGMSVFPAMGAMGAATAVGAGVGQGISDKAHGVALTPEEGTARSKAMIKQGLGGAASEAGGRVITYALGKAIPKVTEWLYNLGLRPPRVIRQNFGGANSPAATGVREHLLPNPEAIQARLSAVEDQVQEAVAHADELPTVRGLLPEGRQTVTIPLGDEGAAAGAPMSALEREQLRDQFRAGTMERITRPLVEDPSGVNAATARVGAASIDPRRLQGGGEFGPVYVSEGSAGAPGGAMRGPGVLLRDQVLPRPSVPTPGAPPTMVDPRQVAAQATKYVLENGNIADRALRAKAIAQLKELADAYVKENGVPMTVAQVLAQKRAEQGLASASYLKLARGGEIDNIETLFHQGVANAARQAVIEKAPEVAALLSREQGLIGLKQAAEFAADRPEVMGRYVKAMSVITGVVSGHPQEGLAGAVILHAIQSPTVSGALAIATKATAGPLARLSPQILRAIMAAYLGEPPAAASMSSHAKKDQP